MKKATVLGLDYWWNIANEQSLSLMTEKKSVFGKEYILVVGWSLGTNLAWLWIEYGGQIILVVGWCLGINYRL